MGKRFITRSRREWELFLQPESADVRPLGSRASLWLASMLERYDQVEPGSPITLAVPERFLAELGRPEPASGKTGEQVVAVR